jgi:aminomuconate-semialdehyde/2-hydroxymuconate-6-semialdehyde dehydrogenase
MANVSTIEGVRVSGDHWIGGVHVPSSDVFLNRSPIDGELLAMVARGGRKEADEAVAVARRAFEVWGNTAPDTRAKILHRIGEAIERCVNELAIVETTDNGSLFHSMRTSVMPQAARSFHLFADQLLALREDDLETDGRSNRVRWEPAGVAVLITPWNAPFVLASWKVAPALAAGDTVVLKPAEWAPLTASMMADIAREAGLPDGVLNVVQGIGAEAGAPLVANPDVDRVSFTGSVTTGKLVAAAAGANLTPVSLELGGKSPFVCFADADLEAAVAQAVNQYDNAGQACLAGTRLLVQREISDAFLERFVERASALRQGDPRLEDTDIGPQITKEHFDRIDGFVQRAKADGAKAVIGGGPNEELGGLYYRPTLFVDAPEGSEILTREVFGPVLTLQSFDDEDEVVAMANASDYGLSAIVFTGDEQRAERISARLVAGTIWVNCPCARDLRAPFGGAKDSGIGREGGRRGFDFYADVKNVCTAEGPSTG